MGTTEIASITFNLHPEAEGRNAKNQIELLQY
jgi:hypothetical protein